MVGFEVKKYKELHTMVNAMLLREITLLIIQSRGGLGKTYITRKALTQEEDEPLLFTGHATPLSVYMNIMEHPHKIVIFDDVDTLWKNKTMIALMKQIADVNEDRIVSYTTSVKYDGKRVPRSFVCNSSVVLLCNDINSAGEDMKAVLTRGFFLNFNPSNEEVMGSLQKFADDKQVLEEFMRLLPHIEHLNFRMYEKAVQLKNSGLDWIDWTRKEYLKNDIFKLLLELKDIKDQQQAYKLWRARTGKSIRAYQKELKKQFPNYKPNKK